MNAVYEWNNAIAVLFPVKYSLIRCWRLFVHSETSGSYKSCKRNSGFIGYSLLEADCWIILTSMTFSHIPKELPYFSIVRRVSLHVAVSVDEFFVIFYYDESQ